MGGDPPTCTVPSTSASTGLDPAGAERGHQIRKEFGILAATKDQLGEQQSIIGEDVHGVVGKMSTWAAFRNARRCLGRAPVAMLAISWR